MLSVFEKKLCDSASLRLVKKTSCFRHLEKPIKTKENKRKHFVFICFYLFCYVFLEGESKYSKRKDAETCSFFFYEHGMHERNGIGSLTLVICGALKERYLKGQSVRAVIWIVIVY